LVGIPSLADNDRFRGYRDDVIKHIERAFLGVDHEVFVTPPQDRPSWSGVVDAQNMLIDKCIREGFDYLWLIQADVEVPEGSFDKLFDLDVDVAQGVVPRHDDRNGLICGFLDENMKVWYLPRGAVEGQVLSGWVFAGLSCTLIRRRVLESGIRFKYKPGVGEDILFLYDVQTKGFVAKVRGDVLCGHLPEWPLTDTSSVTDTSSGFNVLDVGCGHEPKGDVNVDLFPEATSHRSLDQRKCEDKALDVKRIPNFLRADACHLPFRDRAFSKVYSGHTIEHVPDPEAMIEEVLRVSEDSVEIVCPHALCPWGSVESKPLHINALTSEWFHSVLGRISGIQYDVKVNRFGEGTGDVFVEIRKRCLDG
jgi:SAM-dependent methyltransferase